MNTAMEEFILSNVVLSFWFKKYIFESLAQISDFCCMENRLMRMQFYNSRAWLKSNMASTGKTQCILLLRLFNLSLLIKGYLDWLSWSVRLSQEQSHYWEMLT